MINIYLIKKKCLNFIVIFYFYLFKSIRYLVCIKDYFQIKCIISVILVTYAFTINKQIRTKFNIQKP